MVTLLSLFPPPIGRLDICVRLTDCDFVVLAQHDVVGGQVPVKDSFLFVQISQCQHHLSTQTLNQLPEKSQLATTKNPSRYHKKSH